MTEYHARHIEIATNELVQSDEALKAVREIRQRIVDGHEDFAKLAKQHSKDSATAGAGGDMGWFPIDQYGTKVAETVAALKEDAVSQPFQTDVGWHIMQLLGSRQNDRTDEAKRDQARGAAQPQGRRRVRKLPAPDPLRGVCLRDQLEHGIGQPVAMRCRRYGRRQEADGSVIVIR